MNADQLFWYRFSVPVMLNLNKRGRSYMRAMTLDLRCTFNTLKQTMDWLKSQGLVKTDPARDNERIGQYYFLTPKGKTIAECIQKCVGEIEKL